MKTLNQKGSSVVIALLVVLIVISAVGATVLYMKYTNLEEKYEDLQEVYEHLPTNSGDVEAGTIPSIKSGDPVPSNPAPSNPNTPSYISREEVLQIILKDLNVEQSTIRDLDIELENKARYGGMVYEVEFEQGRYEYEYFIEATTGTILDSFQSRD